MYPCGRLLELDNEMKIIPEPPFGHKCDSNAFCDYVTPRPFPTSQHTCTITVITVSPVSLCRWQWEPLELIVPATQRYADNLNVMR